MANEPVSDAPVVGGPRRRLPGPTVTAPVLLKGTVTTAGAPAAPVRLSVAPARLLKPLLAAPRQSPRTPLLLVPLLTAEMVNVDLLLMTVPSPRHRLPTDHSVGPLRLRMVPSRIAVWAMMARFEPAGIVIVPPPRRAPPASTGCPVTLSVTPGITRTSF